jgi:hypothetical protein
MRRGKSRSVLSGIGEEIRTISELSLFMLEKDPAPVSTPRALGGLLRVLR